jgi:ribonuclease D
LAIARSWVLQTVVGLAPDLLVVDTFPAGSFGEMVNVLELVPARALVARPVRAEVAREHNLPAFIIFNDATLRAVAERDPQQLSDLEGVSGIGSKKLHAYGAEVLRVCTAAG